jgi:hypothetical protein
MFYAGVLQALALLWQKRREKYPLVLFIVYSLSVRLCCFILQQHPLRSAEQSAALVRQFTLPI